MGRALHALARIGDVLYIEPFENGLSFRTVNSTKSAYAMIHFLPNFFADYSSGNANPDGEHMKCKIAMKSCLGVFKFPANMSKQIENCQIKFNNGNSKLVFLMKCRHDVVKTHYLTILDNDTLQAVYTKENVPNTLKIQTNVFMEAINNFQATEEEITIDASTDLLYLRNYDSNNNKQKILKTELELMPNEFEDYIVNQNTTVTFSMKELRAVLSFAEFLDLPIKCSFETTGKPIVFIISNESTFEANFVMATTEPDTDQENESMEESRAANKSTFRMKEINNTNANVTEHNRETLFDFTDNISPANINAVRERSTSQKQIPMQTMNMSVSEIPSSPKDSQFNSIVKKVFKRCFEATYNPDNDKPTRSQIFAEDSGEE